MATARNDVGDPHQGPWSQTLHRGLQLLRALAHEPSGLTITELAGRLGVHRAIVYRLTGTLSAHGLVSRGADGRYRLSAGLFELSRGVAPQWEAVAAPVLTKLAEETRATAHLSVASGGMAVALFVIEPRNASMHVAYQPGSEHALTLAASGRAILAGRPPQPGEPKAVAEARARGYAVSRGEIQPGVAGLAAPIRLGEHADASVGVLGFAEFDSATSGRVLRAAEVIAAALAGVPGPEDALQLQDATN
jgi:DNA-binding IclR family transcriptional regulator